MTTGIFASSFFSLECGMGDLRWPGQMPMTAFVSRCLVDAKIFDLVRREVSAVFGALRDREP